MLVLDKSVSLNLIPQVSLVKRGGAPFSRVVRSSCSDSASSPFSVLERWVGEAIACLRSSSALLPALPSQLARLSRALPSSLATLPRSEGPGTAWPSSSGHSFWAREAAPSPSIGPCSSPSSPPPQSQALTGPLQWLLLLPSPPELLTWKWNSFLVIKLN